jgi:hypothetical protein
LDGSVTSEELLRVLMIRAVSVDYLGAGVSPIPFYVEHRSCRPSIHQMILEPLSPPSVMEWVWMATPSTGMVDVPVLAFSAPLALTVHAVVASRGSLRH